MTTKPALPGWEMPPPPWEGCIPVAVLVDGDWDVRWAWPDGKLVEAYMLPEASRIGWPFGLFEGATAEHLRALGFTVWLDPDHARPLPGMEWRERCPACEGRRLRSDLQLDQVLAPIGFQEGRWVFPERLPDEVQLRPELACPRCRGQGQIAVIAEVPS